VAGGHITDIPNECHFKDSVRLAFILTSLNDFKVLVGDVQNAYLNAQTEERFYSTAGPEFATNNVLVDQ
jgi:hypothetical protein